MSFLYPFPLIPQYVCHEFKPAPAEHLLWLQTKERCFSFSTSAAMCGSAACAVSWGRKPLPSIRVLWESSWVLAAPSLPRGPCPLGSVQLPWDWGCLAANHGQGCRCCSQSCAGSWGSDQPPWGQAEGTEPCPWVVSLSRALLANQEGSTLPFPSLPFPSLQCPA